MLPPMLTKLLRAVAATALIAASLALAAPLRAQTLVSLDDIAKVTVLPGWRTARGTHMAAIRIELAEGWKTYWRFPGEAGIPPSFDWTGSKNLANVRLHWPVPKVFYTNGLRSIGYKGVTVIPIELTPASPAGGPIRLRGKLQIGVCEDICIPMTTSLDSNLTPPGRSDAAIRASLARRPKTAAQAGVRSATCSVEPIADGLRITARVTLPKQGKDEVAVLELPDPTIWIAEPKTTRKGRVLTAVTDMVPASGKPFLLTRSDVRITVLAGGKAVEINGCTAG